MRSGLPHHLKPFEVMLGRPRSPHLGTKSGTKFSVRSSGFCALGCARRSEASLPAVADHRVW